MSGPGAASPPERSEEDLAFAARATNVQFRALGHYLRPDRLQGVPSFSWRFNKSKNSRKETVRWLRNAWNTEFVLRQQLDLDEESRRFALQWAFSQAYYACFCQTLSLFVTCGRTERSHSSVLKRFGLLVSAGWYPDEISFFADGGMGQVSIHGPQKGNYPSPLYLELREPRSVENQVAQFLKSTREKALKEKKKDFKLKTKDGKPRKSFRPEHWQKVSDALGPTTVLSILKRKRIKANYREIDTFLSTEISGRGVLTGLVRVVHAFAFVHEAALAAVVSQGEFAELTRAGCAKYPFLSKRAELLR